MKKEKIFPTLLHTIVQGFFGSYDDLSPTKRNLQGKAASQKQKWVLTKSCYSDPNAVCTNLSCENLYFMAFFYFISPTMAFSPAPDGYKYSSKLKQHLQRKHNWMSVEAWQ